MNTNWKHVHAVMAILTLSGLAITSQVLADEEVPVGDEVTLTADEVDANQAAENDPTVLYFTTADGEGDLEGDPSIAYSTTMDGDGTDIDPAVVQLNMGGSATGDLGAALAQGSVVLDAVPAMLEPALDADVSLQTSSIDYADAGTDSSSHTPGAATLRMRGGHLVGRTQQ